jgi:hypothetical protein
MIARSFLVSSMFDSRPSPKNCALAGSHAISATIRTITFNDTDIPVLHRDQAEFSTESCRRALIKVNKKPKSQDMDLLERRLAWLFAATWIFMASLSPPVNGRADGVGYSVWTQ